MQVRKYAKKYVWIALAVCIVYASAGGAAEWVIDRLI